MLKSAQLREKKILRRFLINRRSELSQLFETQNKLHTHVQPLINGIKNEYIGTYISFRDELDTRYLNQYLLDKKINLALPVIDFKKKEINFFLYDKHSKLKKNDYSILEPELKNEIIFPKYILVPLLGYSWNGSRLGYGGGYYDRYLSKNNNCDVKKIGVAFSFQEAHEIPTEEHDVRLDWILTEKNLYKVI